LAAGAFSFWSVLGLFLIGNDNNWVVFSLGSVPRVYLSVNAFYGVLIKVLYFSYVKRLKPLSESTIFLTEFRLRDTINTVM
jgi:hypothetical protein